MNLPNRDPSKPAEQQGLFRKFNVYRTDNSDWSGCKHEHCEYFVIDVTHDAYAGAALKAYADACQETHPELAKDIRTRYLPRVFDEHQDVTFHTLPCAPKMEV